MSREPLRVEPNVRCWRLSGVEALNPLTLTYLNRLSDLLFVIARLLAREAGGQEVLWNRARIEEPG